LETVLLVQLVVVYLLQLHADKIELLHDILDLLFERQQPLFPRRRHIAHVLPFPSPRASNLCVGCQKQLPVAVGAVPHGPVNTTDPSITRSSPHAGRLAARRGSSARPGGEPDRTPPPPSCRPGPRRGCPGCGLFTTGWSASPPASGRTAPR